TEHSPKAFGAILEAKNHAVDTVAGVWENDPKAAKELVADVKTPKTEKEIRNSRDFIALEMDFDMAENSADAREHLERWVATAEKRGWAEARPDLFAAAKLLL